MRASLLWSVEPGAASITMDERGRSSRVSQSALRGRRHAVCTTHPSFARFAFQRFGANANDVEASVSTMNVVEMSDAPHGTSAHSGLIALTCTILDEVFGPARTRNFAVRLWNGETQPSGSTSTPAFTLVLHHPASLRRMFLPPSELSMVESYLRGDIDVEGDLESASTMADEIAKRLGSMRTLARVTRHLLALPSDGKGSVTDAPERGRAKPRGRLHSKDRDAASNRFHYDLGNDFYAMWLDRRMVYSCAYFPPGVNDLD